MHHQTLLFQVGTAPEDGLHSASKGCVVRITVCNSDSVTTPTINLHLRFDHIKWMRDERSRHSRGNTGEEIEKSDGDVPRVMVCHDVRFDCVVNTNVQS